MSTPTNVIYVDSASGDITPNLPPTKLCHFTLVDEEETETHVTYTVYIDCCDEQVPDVFTVQHELPNGCQVCIEVYDDVRLLSVEYEPNPTYIPTEEHDAFFAFVIDDCASRFTNLDDSMEVNPQCLLKIFFQKQTDQYLVLKELDYKRQRRIAEHEAAVATSKLCHMIKNIYKLPGMPGEFEQVTCDTLQDAERLLARVYDSPGMPGSGESWLAIRDACFAKICK